MWWDELAKFMYADEAWTQGQLGLRLGDDPQNVVTTTPKPIELIRSLVERENVHVTAGSTFDNAANLSDTFLEEVRMLYEGTPLGDQELYGKIVLLDGESVFHPEWFWPLRCSADQSHKNRAVARFVGIDTANTIGETSAYSALVVGDVMRNYTMPIRYVSRKKLEFPELVEWVTDEVYPFYYDRKLEAVFIENAASGTQLIQQLRRRGPSWLAHQGDRRQAESRPKR